MKCLACGIDKDLSIQTKYPYPEDNSLCDDPISQLLTIECQGEDVYKMAIMCHECWHKLEISIGIDMWINEACWQSLNPKTPFHCLPKVKNDNKGIIWDAYRYEN